MKLSRDELQRLFRYGYSLTGEEQEAYDLLHHAIEKTMARGITPDEPLRYLMRGMRNHFIDMKRREQRSPSVSLGDVAEGELEATLDLNARGLDDQVIDAMEMEQIWREIEPTERELLYMWAVEEYTAAEIAEQTETPRNTILSRIHRLRNKLAARFGARREEVS